MLALSSNALWISVLVVMATMAALRRDRQMLGFLAALLLALALVDPATAYLLKPWFARLRPCHALDDVFLPGGGCGGLFSFPSNHAVNAGAVVGVLLLSPVSWRRQILPVAVTLAVAVCFSRVWVGVHYPADVVAGLLIGIFSGGSASVVVQRIRKRFHASSGKNSFLD